MKITKVQARALAKRIASELNADYVKKRKEFKFPTKTANKLQSLVDNFNELFIKAKEARQALQKYANNSLGIKDDIWWGGVDVVKASSYERAVANVKFPYGKEVGFQDIEDDIIIESIECTNLDEIISRLKEKYAVVK